MPMIVSPKRQASPGRSSGEFTNQDAFAVLKADGSVVSWGDPSNLSETVAADSQLRSGVTQIFSTKLAFAALKEDGSVITWGASYGGGDSSAVASQLRSGVAQIFSTSHAFAALKTDGSVVSWGNRGSVGDSSAVASQLRSGVTQIFSTESAFAALKADGSVVTWGGLYYGEKGMPIEGYYRGGDSSAVASQLRSGVTQIFSTSDAFAALKEDGSVITWGGVVPRSG